MKKWVFFLLVLAPIVQAELTLELPARDKVNSGDEILLRGYMIEPANMLATFKVLLSCAQERTMLVRAISLANNIRKEFTETLIMPPISEGACKIKAVLESNGRSIDQAQSSTFTITRELNGNFQMNRQAIKLGDTLKIKGDIFKLDGTAIDGTAIVRLKQGKTDYFIDTAKITKGMFDYSFEARENPAGLYAVEIEVMEIFGNQQTFSAGSFAIINNITLVAETEKLHVSPNSKVKLLGEATILNTPIENGKARIEFLGHTQEIEVSNGVFTTTIDIPSDAKTGPHDISVFIVDEFGNLGSFTPRLVVDPSPKKLEVVISRKEFQPGETIAAKPSVKDQTNELIPSDIVIKVITPNNQEALADVIKSGSNFEFTLLNTAMPGTWKVKASALDLEETATFSVGEKKLLAYAMNDQLLLVTNMGNIKFNGPIEVALEGAEKTSTIIKEVALNVNETAAIDLAKKATSGTYDIKVGDAMFKNVAIRGRKESESPWLAYAGALLAIIIIVCLLFLVKRWNFGRKLNTTLRKGKMNREKSESYVHVENLGRDAANKRPLHFKIKKSANQVMFETPRKRTSTQEYRYQGYNADNEGKNKKGGGLFDMFN